MSKKVVIFFGNTQTGKSSTIKDLTGISSIKCGDGSGASTSNSIEVYNPTCPKMPD